MDSGEWRYGQADQSRSGDAAAGRESAGSAQADDPDLWGEDATDGWGTTSSWLPSSRPASTMYPGPPEPDPGRPASGSTPTWSAGAANPAEASAPVWGQPGGWNEAPAAAKYSSTESRHHSAGTTAWSGTERSSEPLRPPAPALPVLPTRGDAAPAAPAFLSPASPAPSASSALAHVPAESPVSPTGEASYRRTGADAWRPPDRARRERVTTEEEFGPRRSDPYGEEPAYGPVLGYTAGWYGIPAVLYLIWLVTLDGDRQGFVGRQFVTSLPWLFAAVVLSLAVAGLLRWAIVGWRALTLSFAAAVIGAGVTTIAHSLAL